MLGTLVLPVPTIPLLAKHPFNWQQNFPEGPLRPREGPRPLTANVNARNIGRLPRDLSKGRRPLSVRKRADDEWHMQVVGEPPRPSNAETLSFALLRRETRKMDLMDIKHLMAPRIDRWLTIVECDGMTEWNRHFN
ncbi:hypothetical protein AVEN_71197-1 [Araneus ventricosus]|uniref:Uncharacterized protein n=1 Tax=Araneus ventricosus TaxID=182803 RepID=A0A4Y2HRJ4_ARAVE|nr:hypothetical protein AVEN_71197-1 [Araneus ventricosus]